MTKNNNMNDTDIMTEVLRRYLATNDITSPTYNTNLLEHVTALVDAIKRENPSDNSPLTEIGDEAAIMNQVSLLFQGMWSQAMGGRKASKYYSNDYPLAVLAQANGEFIHRQIGHLLQQPGLVSEIINLPPAKNDDEASMWLEQTVGLLAAAQNAAAIKQIAKKYSAEEDFNNLIIDNPLAIDHHRKVTHSRTKVGKTLSLDTIIGDLSGDIDPGLEAAETRVDIGNILDALSDTDRNICIMYLRGETQKEIADVLGLTQGAVAKHIKKLKAMFLKFYNNF